MSFEKCIQPLNHQNKEHAQNSHQFPQILCGPSSHLPPNPDSGQLLISFLLLQVHMDHSTISHTWNPTLFPCLWLLSEYFWNTSVLLCLSFVYYFSLLSSIHCVNTLQSVYSFIFWWTLALFTILWTLWIKLHCVNLYDYLLWFIIDKYLGVQCLCKKLSDFQKHCHFQSLSVALHLCKYSVLSVFLIRIFLILHGGVSFCFALYFLEDQRCWASFWAHWTTIYTLLCVNKKLCIFLVKLYSFYFFSLPHCSS